ncbi:MAG TPA: TetR/AcrR family transcriptional regulator [Actinocrinis sp.]|jgi:AcrR family transcriptional regulator
MAARGERTTKNETAPKAMPGLIPPAWASPERDEGGRSGRASRPALSREAIVDAALRIVDSEGYDALSMRRVAQEFGTGAASLYAYVSNRDELEDLLVERVVGECLAPEPGDPETWQQRLKDCLMGSYDVLLSHRDVARVLVGRAPFGPKALANVNAMLGLLREAGLPDRIVGFAPAMLGEYLTGAAIDEQAWQMRYPEGPESEKERWEQVADYLRSLPPDRFRHVIDFAGHMTSGELSEEPYNRFELGLDILIRGVASYREDGRKDGTGGGTATGSAD